ncbi:MAG: DNA adenine methylase [Coleofasciculaceae cyanobacterium RL_1_1]|nr:DNA adenine methylase [Coleofasciculaceae cyanobacterium RL_1_1]
MKSEQKKQVNSVIEVHSTTIKPVTPASYGNYAELNDRQQPGLVSSEVAADTTNTSTPEKTPSLAHPFVKWVGGKRGILQALIDHLPTHLSTLPSDQAPIDRYYEPFTGGGALFLRYNSAVRLPMPASAMSMPI